MGAAETSNSTISASLTAPSAPHSVLKSSDPRASTTFSVVEETTTCPDSFVAGTAGSMGMSLTACDAWVGEQPYRVVAADIGRPVYVQVNDGPRITLTASPAGNDRIEGLPVTPLRTGLTTVRVTGALCAPEPFPSGPQPTTCVLLRIKSPG